MQLFLHTKQFIHLIHLFNDFIENESSVYNLGKSRNRGTQRNTETAVLHPKKLDEKK